jgi:hypothetical protein
MTAAPALSSAPRERPVLFSAPMVRAILEGRKTQTRRLVNPQPAPNSPFDGGTTWMYRPDKGRHVPVGTVGHLTVAEKTGLRCPYGVPGDVLWVKETFKAFTQQRVEYRADYPSLESTTGWTPSIFMPRWASRLTLEVTEVRVERLQEISEEDARAEGVTSERGAVGQSVRPGPREAFAALWDSINGERCPWASNPWVWVVGFRRLEVHRG